MVINLFIPAGITIFVSNQSTQMTRVITKRLTRIFPVDHYVIIFIILIIITIFIFITFIFILLLFIYYYYYYYNSPGLDEICQFCNPFNVFFYFTFIHLFIYLFTVDVCLTEGCVLAGMYGWGTCSLVLLK